ncbi:MAG: DUF1624 domain-containing protein [Alteromonadaceae bacterium]|nr:DUF1624 domain-containing protein [Alteromonadaceae bacterium]
MKQRELSLDIFRGITVAAMILVNTPGSWQHIYAPLKHANWHGITPTDLIFPFFLFAVGNSIFFAFKDRYLNSESLFKVLKRSLILFTIGVLLNAFPFTSEFESLRLMGVLQRIAICYFVVCIFALMFSKRSIIFISVLILLSYSVLLNLFGTDLSLENNLVRRIDLTIIGSTHLYQGFGVPFDPEGLLSTLPAIATTIFGFLIAHFVDREQHNKNKLNHLLKLSLFSLLIGLALSLYIPLNKSLWTVSYVLVSGSLAIAFLTLIIWLTESKRAPMSLNWAKIYGSNPLFVYILSWLFAVTMSQIIIFEYGGKNISLYQWCFEFLSVLLPAKIASLLFATITVVIFYYLSAYLYKKAIFIKI